MKPLIAVSVATGSTGSQVVAQLRQLDWPVRALVRQIDARSEQLRELGAEVVVADLFELDQLNAALHGAKRAYYCPPTHPHMLDSATAFAVAAQEAGLEALVVLSQWLASATHPSILTRQHFLADRMFAAVPDIAHVTVNPGYFAPNYLQTIDIAAQLGILPNPVGESRNAPPSNADIAAGPSDVGAPAHLRQSDAGVRLRRVHDRAGPHLPDRTPAGTFAHGGPTDHVERVAGRPAETLETTTRDYAQLPSAQRTPAQLARVLGNLTRTAITPGGGRARRTATRTVPARCPPGSRSTTPNGWPPTNRWLDRH